MSTVLNAKVSKMPGKGRAKLGTVIRLNLLDCKRQYFPNMVDEVHSALLAVLVIDAQHPEPGTVINGRKLISVRGFWSSQKATRGWPEAAPGAPRHPA
jgi:hypothetical protein